MVEIIEYAQEFEPWFCFVDNMGFSGFDSPYQNETPTERYPEGYVKTFLAKEDHLIVGYISLSDKCSFGMDWADKKNAEINGLAVLPPYRRKGVGHALLEEAIDWCEKEGFSKIYAFINSSARYDLHDFYKNAGFFLEKTHIGLQINGKRETVQMSAEDYWNYQQGIERQRHDNESKKPYNHLPPHSVSWLGFIYSFNLVIDTDQLEFE